METVENELPIDIAIENSGPSAKLISITIPSETVDEKIEESLGVLRDQAQMKGFRKGRAPRALLERRFGTDLLNEARGQLISTAYQQAIAKHELQVIGEPQFPDELAEQMLERGSSYAFTVTVEVVPDFDVPSLTDVPIKKPMFEITDDHIDVELTRIRYRFGTPSKIKGDFEPLDRMAGRAEVYIEGQDEIFFETDQTLVVMPAEEDEGKGPVLGLLIEDLSERLAGASVGDTLEFTTVGPPAHEREEVRGKNVTIKFTINEAERITPIELAEACQAFGLENEEMLKERVKLELETRRDEEQRNAEREQVYEYLLENTSMDLPEKISESQVASTIERQRMEMLYRGMEPVDVEKRLAEIRSQTEEQALNRLKLLFIMNKVARDFEIEVNESEVNGRIAMIARQRGERPDKVRSELTQSGGIQEVARQIADHKAADRIVDQAKVTEIPAEEWNKLAQSKTDERRAAPTKKKKASGETKSKATSKKKTAKKKTTKKSSS